MFLLSLKDDNWNSDWRGWQLFILRFDRCQEFGGILFRYDTKEVKVIPGKTNNLKIKLAPNGITLNEVVVKPKKEKYSKKENPAVKFVKQVIASRKAMIRVTTIISNTINMRRWSLRWMTIIPNPKERKTGQIRFSDRFCRYAWCRYDYSSGVGKGKGGICLLP